MYIISYCLYAAILLLSAMHADNSSAQDSIIANSRVMAVIPAVTGNVDQSVYRQFDRLVPELKKIPKDKIIKLECRYAGQAERERDVFRAYQTASRVEKYLRLQHKLDLDFWITIRLTSKPFKSAPVFTVTVLADDIKNLSSLPVEPEKTGGY